MIMIKRVAAVAALSVTLAGCSARPPEAMPSSSPAETAATMELPQLPDQLPDSIREAARTIPVAIRAGVVVNTGSGVRYDANHVLTAGHVISDTPPQGNCERLAAVGSNGDRPVEGLYSRLTSTHTDTVDIADFTLNAIGNSLPPTAGIKVSDTPPQAGEIVYFVNFEPAADGNRRGPGSTDSRYRQPAIYAGVVLPDQTPGDGQMTVLTGLKSYGAVQDVHSRPGASGGAVLEDNNGTAELLALSVRGTEGPFTPDNIRTNTGVEPTGLPAGTENNLGYTDIQLVDPTTIKRLEDELAAAPACKIPGID